MLGVIDSSVRLTCWPIDMLAYRAHLSSASPPCRATPLVARVFCASRMERPLKYGELAGVRPLED
jgi:hypothetical protein